MNTPPPNPARELARSVAFFQLKLLLDAARDLLLSPVALVAAVIDLVLLKWQPPQLFRLVLRFGEWTDHWIDVWSGGRDEAVGSRENVDVLLNHVEEMLRDPKTGARRARILRRWAERQVARAGRQAVDHSKKALAQRGWMPPPSEPPPPPPG